MIMGLYVLSSCTWISTAQITYLPQPAVKWVASVNVAVDDGNGVFMSPISDIAVVVGSDASITAFNPYGDGTPTWSYKPTTTTPATSTGGAFFSYSATVPYLIYSYTVDDSR